MTNPRQLALDLMNRVEETDSYINLLLPKLLAREDHITDADRGLVQELSYGTLRWKGQYEAFIDVLTPGKTLSKPLRLCLGLGMHQLFRMRIPPHAAIHESVELVKKFEPKAAGLANAVLRNAERAGFDSLLKQSLATKAGLDELAIRYSHPSWVVGALKSALELDGKGAELEGLLESNNETPLVHLAALPGVIGPNETSAADYLESLNLERGLASPIGFIARGNPEPLLEHPGVKVQDQGSQLVALALLAVGNKDGQWLDMCSGPGGKAALIDADISYFGGSLDCFEPIPRRAEMVRQALGPNSKAKVFVEYGQNAKLNHYDAVLLDAPCSGLGSVRRKPESRWRKKPEQLPELIRLQQELLEAAINSLKSGGVVLYSTCSPLIPETNSQIKKALEKHPQMSLENSNQLLNSLNPNLQLGEKRKTTQLWTQTHGTDAMFIAILRKA
ncbi:RsmB/NOP family class I SAM-dependent RNA methyltransferase [Candidatus Aquiluna sp. UB-MaderosW2red]|uniref:RsmB/NOP family class I SAM-dependent RNA methyltransferase n=1 Tax=Candidatus Aquiluna sp. UB-MaderosW2red TaxID=1855377 RepID=UPI000B062AEC|nr:transcription antitermination factor NusB [Candidatus Aquiluna sp. UB-MaderosW2red]